MSEKVVLKIKKLSELFDNTCSLKIPDYQRIYCWSEKNVICLLDDIQGINSEYRLGTLILQKKENECHIIDGQQRLVTLSLILSELNYTGCISLLKERFKNEEACEYIAYNKFIINNYLTRFRDKFNIENLLNYLSFNVLILNDSSLDLAYTFFSNENSRGCPLSDFDLLKAHHLRYITEEKDAEKVSNNWDGMLLKEQFKEIKLEKNYERSLGLYIFRLRKWFNFEEWDENEKLRVKNEYEAAKTIMETPSSTHKYQFKEPIHGGVPFFEYVSKFVDKFKQFAETKQYKELHKTLIGETHIWFRDVIETLLFSYFLKFKTEYLSEALFLITKIISQPRYEHSKIYKETIFEYAKNSKIVISIDRCTSSAFFLAEMVDKAKLLVENGERPIQKRYKKLIQNIEQNLTNTFSIDIKRGL